MARTAVTVTALGHGAGTAVTATTADPTNHHSVAIGGEASRVLFRFANTAGGAKTATVKAGVDPPAGAAGQGDLVVSVPATTGVRYVVVEGARHLQADGSLNVDLEAAFAGTIEAFKLPRQV